MERSFLDLLDLRRGKMLKFEYSNAEQAFDLALDANDRVDDDGGFESAVLFSWFCDARAFDQSLERKTKGWWGDALSPIRNENFGSKLWLAKRGSVNAETLASLQFDLTQALSWMVNDRIARSVSVQVERIGREHVKATANIQRANGSLFSRTWNVHLDQL